MSKQETFLELYLRLITKQVQISMFREVYKEQAEKHKEIIDWADDINSDMIRIMEATMAELFPLDECTIIKETTTQEAMAAANVSLGVFDEYILN